MKIGDLIECSKGIGVITSVPIVKKFAGLIGKVLIDGRVKLMNVSWHDWDEEAKLWRRNAAAQQKFGG